MPASRTSTGNPRVMTGCSGTADRLFPNRSLNILQEFLSIRRLATLKKKPATEPTDWRRELVKRKGVDGMDSLGENQQSVYAALETSERRLRDLVEGSIQGIHIRQTFVCERCLGAHVRLWRRGRHRCAQFHLRLGGGA